MYLLQTQIVSFEGSVGRSAVQMEDKNCAENNLVYPIIFSGKILPWGSHVSTG
jgi:hypothetical protein